MYSRLLHTLYKRHWPQESLLPLLFHCLLSISSKVCKTLPTLSQLCEIEMLCRCQCMNVCTYLAGMDSDEFLMSSAVHQPNSCICADALLIYNLSFLKLSSSTAPVRLSLLLSGRTREKEFSRHKKTTDYSNLFQRNSCHTINRKLWSNHVLLEFGSFPKSFTEMLSGLTAGRAAESSATVNSFFSREERPTSHSSCLCDGDTGITSFLDLKCATGVFWMVQTCLLFWDFYCD